MHHVTLIIRTVRYFNVLKYIKQVLPPPLLDSSTSALHRSQFAKDLASLVGPGNKRMG